MSGIKSAKWVVQSPKDTAFNRGLRWLALAAICLPFAILAGCGESSSPSPSPGPHNVLYISTNNAGFGQNAVVAYTRNPSTGALTQLGVYLTGGTGYKNVNQRLGPDDTDGEIAVSADGKFLVATNAGSNDLSVFAINPDGSLTLEPGSPTSSFGIQPASVTFAGSHLYVVNRGDGILATAAVPTPVAGTPGATNYTAFTLNSDGTLSHIVNSTIGLMDGSSPSQLIATANGQFVFGNNFFVPDSTVSPPAPIFPAARSFLDPLTVSSNGAPVFGTPVALPPADNGAPYILGLRLNPTQSILYAGLVGIGRVASFTYDSAGNLTFDSQEADPKMVGALGGLCWIAIDPGNRYLYTSSVVPDEIGVLSIAGTNGGTAAVPARVQNFPLGGPKGMLPSNTPEPYMFTTAPFNLAVDPSGHFLYVLNNQTCTGNSVDPVNCPLGTAIHILNIGTDGTLSEPTSSPLILPQSLVPYHAKGLLVF